MANLRYISRKFVINCVLKETKLTIFNKQKIATRLSSTFQYTSENDPAPVFFNKEIQTLLKSLTRIDLNKVFHRRKLETKKLDLPVYKFMTEEQLQEAYDEAQKRADDMLQMPPVVKVRQPIKEIVSNDPALQGLETSRLVFTDITFGKRNSERLIVVREPDGSLQRAEWSLRDRINQVYFPVEGRYLRTPKMFEESYLKNILERKEYVFILDRACLQFEPNDEEYQRITAIVYKYIDENNGFNVIRSTRHFGPFVFFLTWFKMIDNLLLELIETAHMEDAVNLVQLYGIMHKIDLKQEGCVEKYIKELAVKRGALELALQAYNELEKERKDLEKGIKIAHGQM